MTPLGRVRALALLAGGLVLLGTLLVVANGIGGVERGGLFGQMSAVEVGLTAFGPAAVAAVAALVLARRLPPRERRAARWARVLAWVVLLTPLVPPLLFVAAMSTM